MPSPVAPDELSSADRGERMQRIRVGVTGLAAVLLIVAIATAIASGVRGSADATAANTAPPAVVATIDKNSTSASTEPLAQLGAAPGASVEKEENGAAKQ